MAQQAYLLKDLVGIKSNHVKLLNALGLWTVKDIAGIIRLSEINPQITSQMILSLFAVEFNLTLESVQSEFIKVIRDSIPNHEWYAIAAVEAPLSLGLLMDEFQTGQNHVESLASGLTQFVESLPHSINLVDLYPDYFSDIRNQGQRGTCVAFAATALHEYFHGRIKLQPCPRLSEDFLYWTSRNIQYHELPSTCHQCGTFIKSALTALIEKGQCRYEILPYQNNQRPCNLQLFDGDISDDLLVCTHDNRAQRKSYLASSKDIPLKIKVDADDYRLQDWEIVELSNIQRVKQALSEGFPVLVGVNVYLSWYSPTSRHNGKINLPFQLELNNLSYQLGGHAILLVGYEDDSPSSSLWYPGGGHFIIRNSWGKSWGDESPNGYNPGYGMLPYAYLSQKPFSAYTIKPKFESAGWGN